MQSDTGRQEKKDQGPDTTPSQLSLCESRENCFFAPLPHRPISDVICNVLLEELLPVMLWGRMTRLTAWPGVGAYTSRSVASIGCQEAVAAVDANVVRVLARLRRCSLPGIGPGAATYQDLANQLLDPERPGDFNQVLVFKQNARRLQHRWDA